MDGSHQPPDVAFDQTQIRNLSISLATDLAAKIHDQSTIFENYGLTEAEGAQLLKNEWFQKMVAQATREWEALENAEERIRVKARLVVEESIADMYKLVKDKSAPGAARVAAFKELKDIAAVQRPERFDGSGAFVAPITIVLGDTSKTIEAVPSHGVTPEAEDAEVVEPDKPDYGGDELLESLGNLLAGSR